CSPAAAGPRNRGTAGRGGCGRGVLGHGQRAGLGRRAAGRRAPGARCGLSSALMSHRRLLLLSNSTNYASGYLDHGMAAIRTFLGPIRTLLFVPYALNDLEGYTLRARNRFAREGIEVRGLELYAHKAARALAAAEAGVVDGVYQCSILER